MCLARNKVVIIEDRPGNYAHCDMLICHGPQASPEIFEVDESSEIIESKKFQQIKLGKDFAKSSEKGFSGQISADLDHPEDCEVMGFVSPMPNEAESLKKATRPCLLKTDCLSFH